MNFLKVPEGGLQLAGSCGPDSVALPQAFVLNLGDDVVEQIIQTVRQGNGLQLQLGSSPSLLFGSSTHHITRPEEEVPFDLYLTKPFESTKRAERIQHAGTLFSKPEIPPSLLEMAVQENKKGKGSRKNPPASSKGSASSGLESDIEALQNGMAAHAKAKAEDRARVVEKLPVGKGKNKLLSSHASLPKSLPPSPALNAARSPISTPQMPFPQQMMERKKEQRFTLVHELAVEDRTTDHLKDTWTGKEEDFRPTLDKIALLSEDSRVWAMKKNIWRELDVWKYQYATPSARQTAIDRAIRQYDKQRLSCSEPEWQRLLPKEERGKGKCLSRLQASIAKGSAQPAPKSKAQKTLDGSGSRDDADSPESDRPRTGGEGMSRSNSNTLPSKAKKPTAQEAQAKRLLSNTKSKSTVAASRMSPTKAKVAVKNDRRVLSAAIIENSDTSEDEAAPVPKSKPVTQKTKDTVVVDVRPSARPETVKQAPIKRPRDDSDSSSSSGTPLSKRIKSKQPLPAPKPRPQAIKASRQGQSRIVSSSVHSNGRNVNRTSPNKSSPLASSPPTNASDLDQDPPHVPKKRKPENEAKPKSAKRRVGESVPADVMNKAHTFKTVYEKYQALHYEITALDNPPHEKVANLVDMRGRLEIMKKEIYKQYSPQAA